MNDRELAYEIERGLTGSDYIAYTLRDSEWRAIIAALRRSQPEGEIKEAMKTALYALGYVAEFAGDGGDHTKADGKDAERAAKVIRAMLSAAEAEGRKS